MTGNVSALYAPDRAVLAEFEVTSDLSVLLRRRPAALLKILDKPVIQHWIERFVGLGIREITIVTGHFPEQVRTFVGGGERWGLDSVHYVSTEPLRNWDQVLEFVGRSPGTAYASLTAFPQRSPAAMSNSRGYWTSSDVRDGYELAFELNTVRDYWAINLESLETVSDPFEPDQMFRISPHATVDAGVRRHGRGIVEQGASIAEQVTLQDSVVGARVQIGRGCSVVRSVLIDGSSANSHLALENMVVDGGLVYSIDHDTVLEIDDAEILSGDEVQAGVAPGILERGLALGLALITLPCRLWPAAATRGALRLSMLWRVVRGDARLFGIRRGDGHYPSWASDQLGRPEGVICLADLTASHDASIEEIAAINAYQINHFTFMDYFKLTGLWFGHLFRRTDSC